MESIGAEVGQKMRSAIKAKLLELNCYVDDELPDYIMVMVANKRTKSQMNEDLNLFLSTKTSTFVDWLHIVLKKLKEVTVTNPEIYKKATKRKSTEVLGAKIKKEKKDVELAKEKKERNLIMKMEHDSLTDDLPVTANRLSEQRKIIVVSENNTNNNDDIFDIPLLSEVNNTSSEKDLQDIEKKIRSVKSRLGLLVDSDLEEELPEIKGEKDDRELYSKQNILKISERIIHIESEQYPEENIISKDDTSMSKTDENSDTIGSNNTNLERKMEHKRITFEDESPPRKLSILERLGTRSNDHLSTNSTRTRISLSEFRKEEEPFLKYFNDKKDKVKTQDWRRQKEYGTDRRKSERENNTRRSSSEEGRRDRSRERRRDRSNDTRPNLRKEGVLSRLGVMSKVSVPPKGPEEPELENELVTREVRSTVQVKPRIVPYGTAQPNKNLLLKAVAEAQRSVAQTPHVGSYNMKSSLLYTEVSRDSERSLGEAPYRKFSQKEKTKLKNLILKAALDNFNASDDDGKTEEEYTPSSVNESVKGIPKYVPSTRLSEDAKDNVDIHHKFIITLDGVENKFSSNDPKPSIKDRLDRRISPVGPVKSPVKSRLDRKKSPSPIIFDKVSAHVGGKLNVPEKLSLVHPPLSAKNKERCKYWPTCRLGDKCEFAHPSNPCEMFPHCKFGDKCLYLHPVCKFGSSCTKRECPYSHSAITKSMSRVISSGAPAKLSTAGLQTCKFFPNCSNGNCQFYHPKPCKFGKYCKNQAECNFAHYFASNKSNLIWRSK